MSELSQRICLVEDDEIMGESLCDRFKLEGYDIDWFKAARPAAEQIGHKHYALVISDVRLPDADGGEVFQGLVGTRPNLPPFIFITGFGSIDRAVELLKQGAADYIAKPFDLDQLVEKVRICCAARERAGVAVPETAELGVSAAMRRIREMVPRIAVQASAILITGESGVGKEHVAALIHRTAHSGIDAPFVAVNCGAVTESLMEAELFGHEKGAFTGAVRAKKGFFEQANGGTLFLDEIAELPLAMQVKLLRAIQERRVTRVGSEKSVPVEFHLVFATNRDLKRMVEEGRFREDLYYRINVIHLRIPPLRERQEDILWFARRFLADFRRNQPGEIRTLHPATEQALLSYPWPGNIRELKHCVERACILSQDSVLRPCDFFDETIVALTAGDPAAAPLSGYLLECERSYIRHALLRHDSHIAETAAELGISRKNLWEKMRKLGLQASGSGDQ